jgi:hypothetical protein
MIIHITKYVQYRQTLVGLWNANYPPADRRETEGMPGAASGLPRP